MIIPLNVPRKPFFTVFLGEFLDQFPMQSRAIPARMPERIHEKISYDTSPIPRKQKKKKKIS